MASVFPYTNGLPTNDTFSDPLSTSPLNSPSHSALHTDVNSAVETLEAIAQATGGRNLLYNGAMQVAQRGTSTASITAAGYYTADRWRLGYITQGTWTQSLENDAPTGSGFRKSLKMLCTTADASPASGDRVAITQALEGQDVQSIRKGTSSAQQLTMSFWVKSNVTGTYIAEIQDTDNSRHVCASYSISSSGVWEYKTITFGADTIGQLNNDNDGSLSIEFWLGAGSGFTSGTLATSWASTVAANRAVGQVNLASATNNYWQVTGVQLNVGSVAAPFEFKSFGQELRECQRYYCRFDNAGAYTQLFYGLASSTSNVRVQAQFPVRMRTTPSTTLDTSATSTFRIVDGVGAANPTSISMAAAHVSPQTAGVDFAAGAVFTQYRPYWIDSSNQTSGSAYVGFSAEL